MADNEQNFDDFLNKPRKSGRTKWVVAALVLAFFAALIFVSIDWVFGALVHTRKEVTVPDLTKKILTQSIYQYIHNDLKLVFGGAYRKIHASEPTELDQQYLGAGEHTPMLEVEQVVWLTNGENVEYSTSRNVFDQRSYTVIDVNDF